ncbi:Os11g0482300 [Oryza sativa Japonica Group]|uniref:Os11g0482300 protein n=2 Tax=Oryza sativa subsp. japonica TaxID=39947 RepID=Q2R498_ORYSJ|nr:hypothetical protein LOC_Os11g29220 [Oryza sativa Japonica Group]EAZ18366.1 hypothetical protein OsJ_33896 [Oryza sativa Japonica Group]BAT14043.1 Os11g0482300 [Oryza sativa Japonica Group]
MWHVNVATKGKNSVGPTSQSHPSSLPLVRRAALSTQWHQCPVIIVIAIDDYESHIKATTRRWLSQSRASSCRSTRGNTADGCGGLSLTITVEEHGGLVNVWLCKWSRTVFMGHGMPEMANGSPLPGD